MVRNIKETFLPRLVCGKSKFCKIQGMSRGEKCMLHAILQGCIKYPMSKELKEIKNTHNTVDLRHLSLMSKESKVHSIDIVLQLYFSC